MRRHPAALFAGLLLSSSVVVAQEPLPAPPAASTVRVFVDCHTGCDTTYVRKELNFVDHVRDKEVADVHILITSERAGGGGEEVHSQFHRSAPVRGEQRHGRVPHATVRHRR